MQVPVVSSAESWKRNKTKSLSKLKDNARRVLHFFALWHESLQKIGGTHSIYLFWWILRGLIREYFSVYRLHILYTPCIIWSKKSLNLFSTSGLNPCDPTTPTPHPYRELRRWCPVLLSVPAILGGAQFCFLLTDCWICPHPQHCLQVCWVQPH